MIYGRLDYDSFRQRLMKSGGIHMPCIRHFRVMAERKRYKDVKHSFRFANETNTTLAEGKSGKQRESQTTGHTVQRRKIIHGMRPIGCKDRSTDLDAFL